MIAGYNALGLTLFRAVVQSDCNIVMSPLSIGMTLAMGLDAATGETADEMAHILGFDGARPDLFAANAPGLGTGRHRWHLHSPSESNGLPAPPRD